MDAQLRADLALSHGFLNLVSASYEGAYVYFNVRARLAPHGGQADAAGKMKPALDVIHGWWRDFHVRRPLVTASGLDAPPDDFVRAWTWLEHGKRHLKGLVNELARTSRVDALTANLAAIHTRVAALCEASYAREYFVKGLVARGDVLGEAQVADRWRQHLLSCQTGLRRAHAQLEAVETMGTRVDTHVVAALLDETLALPAVLAGQAMDITEVFASVGDGLRYETADIEEADIPAWAAAGLPPAEAGRWYGVGMQPDEALAWMRAGVSGPVPAFDFLLRGFGPDAAAPWIAAGVGAREAQARREAGVSPTDAGSR